MFKLGREELLEYKVKRLENNVCFLNGEINAYIEKIEYYSKLNGSLSETIRLKNEEINSLRYANFKLQKDNNSITKEEYNILKSLKDGFRYIGRINDNLFIINIYQNIHFGSDAWQTNFKMFNHLFKFVKNGDQPILISDILNRDVI